MTAPTMKYAASTLHAQLEMFDEALCLEGQAERCEMKAHPLWLRHGARLQPNAGTDTPSTFRFTLEPGTRLRLHERVGCTVAAGVTFPGVVRAVGEGTVDLEIRGLRSSTVDELRVERDTAWMTDRLREHLWALGSARSAVPWDGRWAAALLNGDGGQELDVVPIDAPCEVALDELNEDQLQAVESMCRRPITVVLGPPGTGKTRTLCAGIRTMVDAGRDVLVVAPSNAAADVLLTQLADALADHPQICLGLVQRYGPNPSRELRPDIAELVVPARILGRLHAENAALVTQAESLATDDRSSASVAGAELYAGLVSELHDEAVRYRDIIAGNCRVVVAPIAQVYLHPHLRRGFDCVIIDEGSLACPAAVLAVSGLARERLVIAGDCQQLGPVTTSRDPRVRACLGTDVLTMSGVRDALARDDIPEHVVLLRDQYRMPRAVCNVLNRAYYNEQLRTARSSPEIDLLGYGPLVVVDTSDLRHPMVVGDRTSPAHLDVIASLLDRLADQQVLGDRSIGLVTLYRSQAAAYRRFRDGPYGRAIAISGTVHRSQGSECDVAILDLCDAPGASMPFLSADRVSDEGGRLLNVGLSRGRGVIVVVPLRDVMSRAGRAVRGVLALCAEVGVVVQARSIMTCGIRVASPTNR